MITLEETNSRSALTFRFPDVHDDAKCLIHFQRTLRIPDDKINYPLPPGLGAFPLRHIDDYARRVPAEWLKRGGVVMPMHHGDGISVSAPDVLCLVGMLSFFAAAATRFMASAALVPVKDPRMHESLAFTNI